MNSVIHGVVRKVDVTSPTITKLRLVYDLHTDIAMFDLKAVFLPELSKFTDSEVLAVLSDVLNVHIGDVDYATRLNKHQAQNLLDALGILKVTVNVTEEIGPSELP